VVIRVVVVFVVLLASGRVAAENADLVAARRAVEDVRYDDARRLLVEALKRGTNSPAELREIYRLSAATAQVLGQSDLAEQYYRRLLALDPDATLPADASPKLRQPFVAAQAYMIAQGRLELVAVQRDAEIAVSIVSDPLNMIAGAMANAGGEALARESISMSQRAASLAVAKAADVREVMILDEHGNTLVVIPVSVPEPEAPPPVVEAPAVSTPLVRRWQTWAIPAAVFAGAGVGFFIDAQRSKGRLDDILADDSMFFFDEAEDQRRRWKRNTLIADVSFGIAGVLAVTSVVMFVKRPASRPVVTATVARDRVGVAVHARF
jgi:hypothetical protein